MVSSNLLQEGRNPLNRPYSRLGRIDEFELDRGLTENADDGGLVAAFPHAVIATRRTKPPAGTGTVFSGSKFSPELTHQVPEMTKHSRSVT